MITNLKKTNPRLLLAALLLSVIGLAMPTGAQNRAGSSDSQAAPRVVATSPAIGAKDVDPATAEITVTFDRDMGSGFSWTGGGPEHPVSPAGAKAYWRDARTCVYPVKLEPGHAYQLGINSRSYQNFRSAAGVPASPLTLYFTTKGASSHLATQTAPRIVKLAPLNGARDVSPALTELRVTFSVPMQTGFSWCGGGPEYPNSPAGKGPYWIDDGRTCVLPVELRPGAQYRLGINCPSYKNFRSADGVPLEPVSYTFKTMAQ